MLNTGKKWGTALLLLTLASLLGISALTAVIDPYFHYHAPLSRLTYPIEKERYQNDGIVKHFSYDAILTGTSMTENFKASECDALFGVRSVKTCFSGSSLMEASDHLRRAVGANPDIRLIIRGYDAWNLLEPYDALRESDKIPFYLYDENPFNDVSYLLNKTILLQDTLGVLKHTLKGLPTTSFDDYGRWQQWATFDGSLVLKNYQRPEDAGEQYPWREADAATLTESLDYNAIALARENPQIQFYYFFTPYSIVYLDDQHQRGLLEKQFAALEQATRELLDVENIHVFSFFNDYGTITNLDNYYDPAHYHEDINTLILQRMAAGEYELTWENYEEHWQEVRTFYLGYDYDSLFS